MITFRIKTVRRPYSSILCRGGILLTHKISQLLSDKKNESGIVYCLSRKDTDELSSVLSSQGFNAISYHAGKTAEYRIDAQNRFMTEQAAVMVMTDVLYISNTII